MNRRQFVKKTGTLAAAGLAFKPLWLDAINVQNTHIVCLLEGTRPQEFEHFLNFSWLNASKPIKTIKTTYKGELTATEAIQYHFGTSLTAPISWLITPSSHQNNFNNINLLLLDGTKNLSINTKGQNTLKNIDDFLEKFEKSNKNQHNQIYKSGLIGQDMLALRAARFLAQVLKPNLIVVDIQSPDIAHYNYTAYCNHLRQLNTAIRENFEVLASNPNISLTVMPRFGRNSFGNELLDENHLPGLDHNDPSARNILGITSSSQIII